MDKNYAHWYHYSDQEHLIRQHEKLLNICMKNRIRTKRIVDVIIDICKYFTRKTCCIDANLFGLSISWFVSVVKYSWVFNSVRIYFEFTLGSLGKLFGTLLLGAIVLIGMKYEL